MTETLKKALIIFAKRPLPGRVKTRLTPPLSPEEAANLYSCMMLDTLAKAATILDADRLLFYEDEPEAAPYFRVIADGARIFPQDGDDLGERMKNAFAEAFALGYGSAAIIGTDSPDLPASFVEEAFARLETGDGDAVFGPTEDGGYCLVAMKKPHSGLFEGISWSSGTVLQESLRRAAKEGIKVSLLPAWHDVDTAADLKRPELLDEANDAPLTRGFLGKLQG